MEQQNLPPDEQEEKTKVSYDKSDEMVVISRTTINYILVGVTFLVVGILIGYFGLDKGTDNSPTVATIDEDQLRDVFVSVLADTELNIGGSESTLNQERFELVDDDPYIGDEDAPVVIVEFSDFFCTYCKRHFDQTLTPILENYGQYVRYVYRDFAQLTQESEPAAIAAQCANEQGKFWEFHTEFFNNQSELGRDFYIATAEKFDLDVEAYTQCIDEARYADEVSVDRLDGMLEGVQGTPGFFVNGQLISGAQPYQIFERIIQKELRQAGIDFLNDDSTSQEDTENSDSGT